MSTRSWMSPRLLFPPAPLSRPAPRALDLLFNNRSLPGCSALRLSSSQELLPLLWLPASGQGKSPPALPSPAPITCTAPARGLHSVQTEPLCPAGICNFPDGPGGYLTRKPLLSGLCVLFKCFEIKPFYHVKSLVALVSSSGLKAILFLPLVFDLRFKSARPPWFRGDLGSQRDSQCGKSQGKS